MKSKILHLKKGMLFLSITMLIPSLVYGWGYETSNWKGAYVTAIKGGDGALAGGFDGVYLTGKAKWGSYVVPNQINIHFAQPQVFTKYELATVDWKEGAKARSPKVWRLEASNNNKDWTILDERTNGNEVFTDARLNIEFQFTNNTAYATYRFVFTEVISGNLMGIAEINFPEFTTPTMPFYPENEMTVVNEKLYFENDMAKATDTEITVNSAVYVGSDIVELGVVYSTSESDPTIENSIKAVGAYTTNPINTTKITGLTPGTTYYVRPFATNSIGTSYYNKVYTITTSNKEGLKFATSSPTSRTSSSASMSVNILNDVSDSEITECGIVWNTTGGATTASSGKFVNGNATVGTFTGLLSGLTPATLYYVRPYLTNADGTYYGAEYTFYSTFLEQCEWKEGVLVETDLTDDSYKWRNFLNNAFDGNVITNFTNQVNSYMTFTFDKPQILKSYEMAPGPDNARRPKSWTLKGSNDKTVWTDLDAQTNYTWSNNAIVKFDFSNTNAYKYYKIQIMENNGGDRVIISEFNFPDFPNDTIVGIISDKADLDIKYFVTTDGRLTILNNSATQLGVAVYNTSGALVAKTSSDQGHIAIDKQLESGIYLVKLQIKQT